MNLNNFLSDFKNINFEYYKNKRDKYKKILEDCYNNHFFTNIYYSVHILIYLINKILIFLIKNNLIKDETNREDIYYTKKINDIINIRHKKVDNKMINEPIINFILLNLNNEKTILTNICDYLNNSKEYNEFDIHNYKDTDHHNYNYIYIIINELVYNINILLNELNETNN
jgi:hypothetical protein